MNIRKNLFKKFGGATFQACLHENNTLLICFALNSMQILGALLWLSGALFGISGANSPRTPVYFFPIMNVSQIHILLDLVAE